MAANTGKQPLLSHYDSEEPGIVSLRDEGKCHWLQTTSALLALQMGWGLWLFASVFADLGWAPAIGTLVTLALLTVYSGTLFARLFARTPGAVLFGDIGYAAAGGWGQGVVYTVFYSLNATRGLLLHLACTQSLLHVFASNNAPPLWQCGFAVFLVAAVLVQIRSLARLSIVFVTGTFCQLFVFFCVLFNLIASPDPTAKTVVNNVIPGNYERALIAVMNIVFAYGGQFAFTEIMGSMKEPIQFPRAVLLCSSVMTVLYGGLGSIGYWSRGDTLEGIIIFDLGDGPVARAAAGFILVQAISQYLVNLNVWTHNLLVLVFRCTAAKRHANSIPGGDYEVIGSEEEKPCPKCPTDHHWLSWMAVSVFVISYSFLICISIPYFNLLVGLITGATYLLAAYALPAWFILRLCADSLHKMEKCVLLLLIPASILLSVGGFYSSLEKLLEKMHDDGVGHGWRTDPSAPNLGTALLQLAGINAA